MYEHSISSSHETDTLNCERYGLEKYCLIKFGSAGGILFDRDGDLQTLLLWQSWLEDLKAIVGEE